MKILESSFSQSHFQELFHAHTSFFLFIIAICRTIKNSSSKGSDAYVKTKLISYNHL